MKKLLLGFFLVVLIGGLSACGTGGAVPEYFYSQGSENGIIVMAPAPESLRHSLGLDSSPLGDVFVGLDSDNSKGLPPPGFGETTQTVAGGTSLPEAPAAAAPVIDRMIVRTGNISLVVEDVEASVERITQLAGTYNGYVVNAESWQEGERMVGNIAIRVDAVYFDTAVQSLKDMAVEVKSQTSYGQDVTEEYVDLDATLTNLEISETQLMVLMEKAGTVEEILDVQRELTSTTERIEKIRGRMQYLEQSAATSLIQVNLEHSQLAIEFTAHTRIVKEGEKVWFRADVFGGFTPYGYRWDFGDGDISTDDQPYHTYNSDGTYTVILTVTDDRGTTDVFERATYITVLPGWSFASVVRNIWNGVIVFAKVILNILIGIGVSSPVWIVILVILYFTWWRRRKQRKQAKPVTEPEK